MKQDSDNELQRSESSNGHHKGQNTVQIVYAITVFLTLCGAVCSFYFFFRIHTVEKDYRDVLLPSTNLEIEIECAKRINSDRFNDLLSSSRGKDLHTVQRLFQNSELYNELLECMAAYQSTYTKRFEAFTALRRKYTRALWTAILCTILFPIICFLYQSRKTHTTQ